MGFKCEFANGRACCESEVIAGILQFELLVIARRVV